MARPLPTVQWNEAKQRWMAWVTFPDGSRKKVERVQRSDADDDLKDLLARRAARTSVGRRRQRLASFAEVIDAWLAEGAPRPPAGKRSRRAKRKSENTISKVRSLLDNHVRRKIGELRVDRTAVERVEAVFQKMDDAGYATSTIDHTWSYLNQACEYGLRKGIHETNPVADVLLPEARLAKQRKSFSVEQLENLLMVAIPDDPKPARWVTGLMCGLRPGEITGLRWTYVDVDCDEPYLLVAERANEVNKRSCSSAARWGS